MTITARDFADARARIKHGTSTLEDELTVAIAAVRVADASEEHARGTARHQHTLGTDQG